jgi:hypothetical protein
MMAGSMKHRKRMAGVVIACASVFAAASCVIADPPTELPKLPPSRPVIVRGSVVPAVSAILGRWPDTFIVPVELVDPRATVFASAFVDYNAATGEGLDGRPQVFEPGTTEAALRTLEIRITEPALDRCHTVEIVVALRAGSFTDPRIAHTPPEPGGDSVNWFYSPGGDLAGCPTLDAGLDAGADAGPDADAGDAGGEVQ